MSAKAKRIERSQRFKRAWRGENRKKAVSPVVATLILILIAVAAAAALYLWLVAWQGGVTGGIGNPSAQYTVSIGGSTSVYPFAEIAATQFEQNNSDVVVSVNQGGSGAGMAAVCSGQVNIGEASAYYSASSLETADGCPTTLNEQIVAYDGVDVITQKANTHGLVSMSWDTLQSVIAVSTTAAPTSGFQYTLTNPTFDGVLLTGVTGYVAPTQGTGFAWDQLPACAISTPAAACVGATDEAADAGGIVSPGTTAACGGAYSGPALCYTAAGSPCGFVVCAAGAANIHVYYRSDVSGTTQSFLSRLVAAGAATWTGTQTPQSVGFTGCSGDNQLDGCGASYSSTAATGENGNPAVITAVSGDPNGLGYASDGLVQQSSSGVAAVSFEGYGQTSPVAMSSASTALSAIAHGIAAYNAGTWTSATATAYIGWRPFLNVETAPPTGEVLRYLEFVMDPANNENFAAQSSEISVYASGLAGVVPVTPITGYQVTI